MKKTKIIMAKALPLIMCAGILETSKHFTGSDGYTYYYVTEDTYSTRINGTIMSVVTGLLALIQGIGSFYTVIIYMSKFLLEV